MVIHRHFYTDKLGSLSLETQQQAVCQFLEDIEEHFKYKILLHSQQPIARQDLYIPIHVTLERRYRHEVESLWGYAESDVELQQAYTLKRREVESQRYPILWDDAKTQHQTIMVLADPGMGKSALLRREVALRAAEERQKLLGGKITVDEVVFPLFMRLAELDAVPGEIPQGICQLVQRDYPKTWTVIEPILTAKLRTGQCLLLFNALDEVPQGHRNFLSEKINQFLQDHPCPVICTSRIVGYGRSFIKGAKEVEIVPFSQPQIEQFIKTWFELTSGTSCNKPEAKPPKPCPQAQPRIKIGARSEFEQVPGAIRNDEVSARGLIEELGHKPQLRGLAKNPRLLYLLCSLYQENELNPGTRRCQIYEKTVNYLVRKWQGKGESQSEGTIQAKIQLLENLAYTFTCQGKDIFSYDELKHQIENYRQSDRIPQILDQYTPEDLLAELSGEGCILQNLAREGNRYVFIHRMTQDYLTAAYLKRRIQDHRSQGIAFAREHFWDYDWHQSLSLLAGLLDNPIPLLEAIHQEKDDIFSSMVLLAGRAIAECEDNAHPLITDIINRIYQLWHRYPFVGFIASTVVALGQTNSQMAQRLQTELDQKHYYTRKDFVAALIAALGQIGSPQAVETLIQALHQGPWYVRGEAAGALGRIGTTQALNALIPALQDEDSIVRGEVADALGQIGGSSAIQALMVALHDTDSYVRGEAAVALTQIGTPEALTELIKVLNHPDSFVRWEATEACRISSPPVVQVLINALNHQQRHIREEAAGILGRIASPQALEALIFALHDTDSIVREEAAAALGRVGNPQTLDALIPVLDDEDSIVREEVADALGRMGSTQAVTALISALKDEDPQVRKHVVEALAEIGNAQALPALIPLLQDQDGDVRGAVAGALGHIGDSQALQALIPALQDQDWFVREQVAVALARIGTSETLEQLLHLPQEEIERPEIFTLMRTLAVRFSREGMALIPVYPELIGPLGFFHRLWRKGGMGNGRK